MNVPSRGAIVCLPTPLHPWHNHSFTELDNQLNDFVKYIASQTPHSFLKVSGEDIAFLLTVKWKQLQDNVFTYFHNLSIRPGFLGLPLWLRWLRPASNAGDLGSSPGLGRSHGGGHGTPLQYLAWKIPWTEEPGRLQSIGLQRVRHDWATKPSTAHWLSSHYREYHSHLCDGKTFLRIRPRSTPVLLAPPHCRPRPPYSSTFKCPPTHKGCLLGEMEIPSGGQ